MLPGSDVPREVSVLNNKNMRTRLQRFGWRAAELLRPWRQVSARGATFDLPCESWITHYRWETFEVKEPDTLDWIDQLPENGTLLDVGANIGVYSVYAAIKRPDLRIIAVEPEYGNLELLKRVLWHNQLQRRVEVYGLAFSHRVGLTRLHIHSLEAGTALHTESSADLVRTLAGKAVVWSEGTYAITVDAFCSEACVSPTAIKIDVDGSEPRILAGAEAVLRHPRMRTVLVERPSDRYAVQECHSLLSEAGFYVTEHPASVTTGNEIWLKAG